MIGCARGAAGVKRRIFVRGSSAYTSPNIPASVTISIPTGTQVGDLLVAHICFNGTGLTGSMAATGWTQRQAYNNTDYLFTKTATSGDISAGSVTFGSFTAGGGSGGGTFACIVAFGNAAGLDTTGYFRQSSSGTTYTYPSVTPSQKGDAIFLANKATGPTPSGSQFPLAAPSGGNAVIQQSYVGTSGTTNKILGQVATDIVNSISATAYSITQAGSTDVGFIAAIKSK